jgi:hypothetical protein
MEESALDNGKSPVAKAQTGGEWKGFAASFCVHSPAKNKSA